MLLPQTNDDADLKKLLQQQTEHKQDIVIEQDIKTSQFNIDDFNPELIDPEPAPEPAVHFETEKPKAEPEPIINYSDQADIVIGSIDGFQSMILPTLYRKSIFSAKEKEILKKWEREGRPKPENLSQEEKLLFSKYNDFTKLVEDIPFSEKEENLLRLPLAKVLEKHKIKTSAELLLFGALLTVMAPRILPMFHRAESKLWKKE